MPHFTAVWSVLDSVLGAGQDWMQNLMIPVEFSGQHSPYTPPVFSVRICECKVMLVQREEALCQQSGLFGHQS